MAPKKARKAFKLLNVFVLIILSCQIPFSAGDEEGDDDGKFSTELKGNSSRFVHWNLYENNNTHILNCKLAEGAMYDKFQWRYANGSDHFNESEVTISKEADGSISLSFSNITYNIIDTYQCISTKIIEDGERNYTTWNATDVTIFVAVKRDLDIVIGMSVAAIAFFFLGLYIIKKIQ